jgi:hypothetical protein
MAKLSTRSHSCEQVYVNPDRGTRWRCGGSAYRRFEGRWLCPAHFEMAKHEQGGAVMTAKEATWRAGRAYVRRLRNWSKRQYAIDYLDYLMDGGPEPIRPAGLSLISRHGLPHIQRQRGVGLAVAVDVGVLTVRVGLRVRCLRYRGLRSAGGWRWRNWGSLGRHRRRSLRG